MWRCVQDAKFQRAAVSDSLTLQACGLMAPGNDLKKGSPVIVLPLSKEYRPDSTDTSIAPDERIIDMTREDNVHMLWAAAG